MPVPPSGTTRPAKTNRPRLAPKVSTSRIQPPADVRMEVGKSSVESVRVTTPDAVEQNTMNTQGRAMSEAGPR